MSYYPDYLAPFLLENKSVEFVKTDMSDFSERVKEIISKRNESPLLYHNTMVARMQEISRTHLSHAGAIRALAYALTVYSDKMTWVPRMEDGFSPALLRDVIFPDGIPTEVVDRIKRKWF